MRLAYNTFADAGETDVEGLLGDVAGAGFTGVGLFSRHAAALARGRATARPQDLGLAVVGYYVEFLRYADQRLDDTVAAAVDACRRLRCPWLVVVPDPEWATRRHGPASLAAVLRETARDVGVLLEPLSPLMADVSCLHTVAQTLHLLEGIPPERGGWVLDVVQLTDDACRLDPEAVDRLAVVQLADLRRSTDHPDRRVPPGAGALPLREVVRPLVRQGFEGWWEVETMTGGAAGRGPRLRRLHDTVSGLVAP